MMNVHLLCGQGAGKPLIDNGNETYFPIVKGRPSPRQCWSLRVEKCEQVFQNPRSFHYCLVTVIMANDLNFFGAHQIP